jgi:hypothetical protein
MRSTKHEAWSMKHEARSLRSSMKQQGRGRGLRPPAPPPSLWGQRWLTRTQKRLGPAEMATPGRAQQLQLWVGGGGRIQNTAGGGLGFAFLPTGLASCVLASAVSQSTPARAAFSCKPRAICLLLT